MHQHARFIPVGDLPGRTAAAPERKRSAQIDDFGEHMPGARKDQESARLQAGYDADEGFQGKLSDSWPKPDWVLLQTQDILADRNPGNLAFVRSLRDQLKTTEGKWYERKQYMNDRRHASLRRLAMDVMDDRTTVREALGTLRRTCVRTHDKCDDRHVLYKIVGHKHDLSSYFVLKSYQSPRTPRDPTGFSICSTQSTAVYGAGSSTLEEAAAELKADLEESEPADKARTSFPFEMFVSRGRTPPVYSICRKVAGRWVEAMEFDTKDETRDVFLNQRERLEQWWEDWRRIPESRQPRNASRTPPGADGTIDPDEFLRRYRFRGVQFGNWVEAARRESDLAEASQALSDLAIALNWPVSTLALNDRLGLAFGARGKGGANAPKAHYESDRRMIALSKPAGPGSLAHEWFHGFDHYVGAISDAKPRVQLRAPGSGHDPPRRASTYATQQQNPTTPQNPAAKVHDALREYARVLNRSGMKERSKKLDLRRARKKPYWSTTIELAARAFEAWVAEELAQKGIRNDYLVNYTRPDEWKGQSDLDQDYPYPYSDELILIGRCIDDIARHGCPGAK